MADTWDQITKIPFRCDPGEAISEGSWQESSKISIELGGDADAEFVCVSADALMELAWPLLLASAAASPANDDTALLRMIKDAADYGGIKEPHKPSDEEQELVQETRDLVPASLAAGRQRLEGLVVGRRAEWSALASTKKKHKQRRAIDRRFDGPKHRRTRDYDSDSDGGDGECSIM